MDRSDQLMALKEMGIHNRGIQVRAGVPELPVDELLKLYLGWDIAYGNDGSGGHHHGHEC